MAVTLPRGTVTFLFTDIEGSTRLLHELGDAYAGVLADHRRTVREAVRRHHGVEVDTEGDAFFVAFERAQDAVAGAEAMQIELADGPVRIRAGLHTGTPTLTDEGYVGLDVHKAARIAAAAHGGQIVLSGETRALLVPGSELLDLGEHRLKDFDAPVWLYQLGSNHFPPLRTISNTNLPRPASSFVGREREVGEVRALLDGGARLVTLTGPGGTGKTRLAIEVAAGLVGELRNGVFWIDLASLTDPELVLESTASALGAREELAAHIADRELLLVLDNFEQVADAAPGLAQLLERCPNLRLVVTSRELLRIRGEREYEVHPLAQTEAIDLFCARSGLEPGPAVAELCGRLDHLPLAVELAAARTRALSPEQIVERLARQLDLFTGGRDAEPRQRTLRATIEWSHALLDAEERLLFLRLAVFAGGWTLEAAEEVVGAGFDGLQSLVEKSLVRREGARFSMLGTIREYAAERLAESGEDGEQRDRHARHFLALAEMAAPHLIAYSREWFDRLEGEHDNLRSALDRLTSSGDAQTAMRLAGALPRFWDEKGHLAEGRRRLEALLALDARPTPPRAGALIAASDMAVSLGDATAARGWAEEALDLHRSLGDRHGVAVSEFLLGLALADAGDQAAARELFESSSRAFEDLGERHYELAATRMRAWMTYRLGDREAGKALHQRNLERAQEVGNSHLEASTREALAMIALDEERVVDAVALLREGHLTGREAEDAQGVARSVSRAARALAAAGQARTAAELLAGVEVLHEVSGATARPWLAEMNERTLADVSDQLGEAGIAEAWERGRALGPEQALALALEGLESGLRSSA